MTIGQSQPGYECAEFVSRALAAGGFIPNLGPFDSQVLIIINNSFYIYFYNLLFYYLIHCLLLECLLYLQIRWHWVRLALGVKQTGNAFRYYKRRERGRGEKSRQRRSHKKRREEGEERREESNIYYFKRIGRFVEETWMDCIGQQDPCGSWLCLGMLFILSL